ncbi:Putative SWR1-complex protein 4/DNA methyltransferase 1-associated protein [Septoria linicola]|uniref:SWR1-complex protein 4 n=1 Tax=Septoria linicola TaxID=215465 RepID=A0A9Q9AYD9_9PEZI|nr:putative SWR1-complex protein 4/DNA methyltransferase 1-associated protein [Septoria linicola]USW58267.1 Putative SWR1-complex protein 4/DNA methyltransferase 1-associated protein [Septoria linicola]
MQRMRKAAKWTQEDRRWRRADATNPPPDFSKYNVKAEIPEYDDEAYEQHLRHDDWTKAETDYLVELYRDCNGKWPVVWDHYEYEDKSRSMEELKARFYKISAQLLQLKSPIQSMGGSEFELYNILNTFDPAKEESRKSLAKGHLYRKANEVDEETVLLGELQRIMVNQASLDGQREELRKRLDYPHAGTNGYQYSTSQALTQLWQQLLAQDRMKKNPRLKPTGNPNYDGFVPPGGMQPPSSARPRDSTAGLSDIGGGGSTRDRRGTRGDSISGNAPATPAHTLPVSLSPAEQTRMGVVIFPPDQKASGGISFASDRLTKPRVAKSTIQSEKIATILASAGVPEVIPLPTPNVVEAFEVIMSKVQALLDLRKLGEKDELELKVRRSETG